MAFVALGLPMATLHGCGGEEDAYLGVQFAVLGLPPLSAFPLLLLGFLGWAAARRSPDAPDIDQLLAASRYTAAALGAVLTVVLPYLANVGGETTWHLGGWVLMGGWGFTAIAAGADAAWPLSLQGPDPNPAFRHVSLAARWTLVGALLLSGLGFGAFAEIDPETGPNAALDYCEVAGASLVLLALPLFFLMRAFEARLYADRRGGRALVALGLALGALGALVGLGGVALDQLERAAMAEERAAAAAEEAAQEAAERAP